MKVVFFDEWERPEERLKGTTAILRRLASIAGRAKAAYERWNQHEIEYGRHGHPDRAGNQDGAILMQGEQYVDIFFRCNACPSGNNDQSEKGQISLQDRALQERQQHHNDAKGAGRHQHGPSDGFQPQFAGEVMETRHVRTGRAADQGRCLRLDDHGDDHSVHDIGNRPEEDVDTRQFEAECQRDQIAVE
jgi:hypothetical protein